MSVIKKTPVIESIVGQLTETQIATLGTAINSTTPETFKSLINHAYNFTALTNDAPADIGAYMVQLDAQHTRNGIAIRVLLTGVVYEHLLVYGESQKITIYELDTANGTYKLIEEYCDINELRRVVNDRGGNSGPGVFTDLHVEGDLQVDGDTQLDGDVSIGLATGAMANTSDVQIHGDAQVHGDVILDSLQNITDPDGDAIIPDPTGHLNEVLTHISTGYDWKSILDLGAIQVVAKATFEGGEFVTHTGVVYIVYDTDATCYVRYYVS